MNIYDERVERISKMPEKEFEQLFMDLHELIAEDPLKHFVENPLFMDTELTPGQTVLAKLVMKQKLDRTTKYLVYEEIVDENGDFWLIKKHWTEVEYYEFMTGKKYDPELIEIFTDISLIVGRRGGKSLTSAILAIFSAIKMNWKPMLGKHKVATILVMSHTKEFSDEIIDLVRGLIEDSPILTRLIDRTKKNTQSTINLKIPFRNPETNRRVYSRVRIRTNAASSKSTRGSACPVILADEIAFWGSDPNSKESDSKIVNAASPSQLQFGDEAMFIKLSSPGIKSGVLWNEFNNRQKLPKTSLILKAPSWVFNNRYEPKEFKKEWQKCQLDPELDFDSEFRANFVDSMSDFILSDMVDMCTLKGVDFLPPDESKDIQYAAAIDAAFKSDRFVFSLVGTKNGRVRQYVLKIWEGNKTETIKAFKLAQYISNICKEYKITKVHADQYAFQPLKEIFEQYNVTLEERTFTNTFKKKIYYNLKKLIHSQEIDLLDNEISKREIKQLQVEKTGTGTIKISHPSGGNDDAADATAVSAFVAIEQLGSLAIDTSQFTGTYAAERHGIRTDRDGRAFEAPAPEMLESFFGTVYDNSGLYRKNPETGRYERIEDEEEDDPNFGII